MAISRAVLLFTLLAVVLSLCQSAHLRSSASAMGEDEDVAKLRNTAAQIQTRFLSAEKKPDFGKGLPPATLSEVKGQSEKFWNDLKGLSQEDLQGVSASDGLFLIVVVT